mgnify:CR=1 FL=1
MPDIFTLENKIKQIIDELKGLCQTNGLANQASEEVVITSVFLYKFLNDKFMANLKVFADEIGISYEEVLKNENAEMDAFYDTYSQNDAACHIIIFDQILKNGGIKIKIFLKRIAKIKLFLTDNAKNIFRKVIPLGNFYIFLHAGYFRQIIKIFAN